MSQLYKQNVLHSKTKNDQLRSVLISKSKLSKRNVEMAFEILSNNHSKQSLCCIDPSLELLTFLKKFLESKFDLKRKTEHYLKPLILSIGSGSGLFEVLLQNCVEENFDLIAIDKYDTNIFLNQESFITSDTPIEFVLNPSVLVSVYIRNVTILIDYLSFYIKLLKTSANEVFKDNFILILIGPINEDFILNKHFIEKNFNYEMLYFGCGNKNFVCSEENLKLVNFISNFDQIKILKVFFEEVATESTKDLIVIKTELQQPGCESYFIIFESKNCTGQQNPAIILKQEFWIWSIWRIISLQLYRRKYLNSYFGIDEMKDNKSGFVKMKNGAHIPTHGSPLLKIQICKRNLFRMKQILVCNNLHQGVLLQEGGLRRKLFQKPSVGWKTVIH
ncbi:hypothetical protein HDU92_008400 [Lobulomyces angularis]|nr:hypothetical protein HDU92_008400 [Lobulomyces angularis]